MLGFVNKIFSSVQLIVFLCHVLLLAELAQKFKFLQNSCMANWFYETELRGIYLYLNSRINNIWDNYINCLNAIAKRIVKWPDFTWKINVSHYFKYAKTTQIRILKVRQFQNFRIYEFIVSPKIRTKNCQDFCPV